MAALDDDVLGAPGHEEVAVGLETAAEIACSETDAHHPIGLAGIDVQPGPFLELLAVRLRRQRRDGSRPSAGLQ